MSALIHGTGSSTTLRKRSAIDFHDCNSIFIGHGESTLPSIYFGTKAESQGAPLPFVGEAMFRAHLGSTGSPIEFDPSNAVYIGQGAITSGWFYSCEFDGALGSPALIVGDAMVIGDSKFEIYQANPAYSLSQADIYQQATAHPSEGAMVIASSPHSLISAHHPLINVGQEKYSEPLFWGFFGLLSQWTLTSALHASLLRQLKGLLGDEEELASEQIVPDRVSFAHLVKFFSSSPTLKPPTLTMGRSGVFVAIWQPKPRLRMTFEFREDGRIRWIFTDSTDRSKLLTGAGFILPEKVVDLTKAYGSDSWMNM